MFRKYSKGGDAPAPIPANTAPLPESPKLVRADTGPAAADPEQTREQKRRTRLLNIKVDLHRRLLETLNLSVIDRVPEAELRREVAAISSEGLREMGVVLSAGEAEQLTSELMDEVTGLGPLEPLLKDDTISDILVNGSQQVFVERFGKLQLTDVQFKDEKHLLRVIDKIVSAVGRRVDPQIFKKAALGRQAGRGGRVH
jgi:pilus assembly protein CpaF